MNYKKISPISFLFSLALVFIFHASSASAAIVDLHGQAYSSNIGWISFEGVQYDETTGNLSGGAWSSNVGWLSFNRTSLGATGNPPAPDIGGGSGAIARIDPVTGKVSGWARFLSNDGTGPNKWDGWVKLSSTGSDPAFGVTKSGTSLTGEAWGSLNIGWIRFCDTGFCVTTDVPTTGTAEIKRVDPSFSLFNTPDAVLDGGSPQSANPYFSPPIAISPPNHNFSSEFLPGYTVMAATCDTPGCTMGLASDYSITPTLSGGLYTVNLPVTAGNLRRVAFMYTPAALSVSCSVSPTSGVTVGVPVTWVAVPSGGTGAYTYSWSGSESLAGSTVSISKTYGAIGTKTASITVTSGAQSITQACSNSVTISGGGGSGTFIIRHLFLPEPDPTLPAVTDCHENNPDCLIGGVRRGHFYRDISIAESVSSPTELIVEPKNGFVGEQVVIRVVGVKRDDSVSPGSTNCPAGIIPPCPDGVGEGGLMTPAEAGFLFYFHGNRSKTVSDAINLGSKVVFKADRTRATKGRYIVYLQGESQPSKIKFDTELLLVFGTGVQGYKER